MNQVSLQMPDAQKPTLPLSLETNPPVVFCSGWVILSILLLAAVTTSPRLVRAAAVGSEIPFTLGARQNLVRGTRVADSVSAQHRRVAEAYGRLPLSFEANEGQTDRQVRFLARGPGYTLFLTSSAEAVLVSGQGQPQVVRLELAGANPRPEVRALEESAANSYYFIGNDPMRWRTRVAHYGRRAVCGGLPRH